MELRNSSFTQVSRGCIYALVLVDAAEAQETRDLSVAAGEVCIREMRGTGECVQSGGGEGQIHITVKFDKITMKSSKLNKGNCQRLAETMGIKQFSKEAKFVDRIDVIVMCNPILVELETDRGHYGYEVKKQCSECIVETSSLFRK